MNVRQGSVCRGQQARGQIQGVSRGESKVVGGFELLAYVQECECECVCVCE